MPIMLKIRGKPERWLSTGPTWQYMESEPSQIILVGGWKSTDMVMKYIEKADMSFINELRS